MLLFFCWYIFNLKVNTMLFLNINVILSLILKAYDEIMHIFSAFISLASSDFSRLERPGSSMPQNALHCLCHSKRTCACLHEWPWWPGKWSHSLIFMALLWTQFNRFMSCTGHARAECNTSGEVSESRIEGRITSLNGESPPSTCWPYIIFMQLRIKLPFWAASVHY